LEEKNPIVPLALRKAVLLKGLSHEIEIAYIWWDELY
jgi:hypothetical protein